MVFHRELDSERQEAVGIFLYRTEDGVVAGEAGRLRILAGLAWDAIFRATDPASLLREAIGTGGDAVECPAPLAPIIGQEVWAAGVTYLRSREARVQESQDAGGGDFYDRVYDAARPELFFKSTAHRTVGPGGHVRIRRDAAWNVPEPELTLAVSASGRIFGYTIGNDMSSRDIEGENPLYLPQAKVYDGSCALGPCIYVKDTPLPGETPITLAIRRAGQELFRGGTEISQIKRSFVSLVEYLYRDNSFPHGCFLMTGTGVVPGDGFTLQPGDEINIEIPPMGTLSNQVARY
jgi:2-dehydro-3-deoxy-D-arabinonate dehydratase